MGEIIKNATVRNLWFKLLAGFAMALIIAGFIVPPTGVIDGSVLTAVGEVFAFAALGTAIKAMDKGLSAKVRHNDTVVSLGHDEDHHHDNT